MGAGSTLVVPQVMPVKGSVVPPPVNDVGSKGSSDAYSPADHTHVSSVFASFVTTADTTGVVTWTYPTGFFTEKPVLALTVEDASNNAMQAKLTSSTKDGGSAKIIASRPLSSVLNNLLSFDVFGGTVPVGTILNIIARKKRTTT